MRNDCLSKTRRTRLTSTAVLLVALLAAPAFSAAADEAPIGRDVDSLLAYAREHNPEFASVRYEADAAVERVAPAGALPDPKLRTELMDLTRQGTQSPTVLPGRVGSARYTLMQDVPWFGKRELKREIAELEAEGSRSRATGVWLDISARIKSGFAQLYYVVRSEALNHEILTLMIRLEQVAQLRYASGLAAQQDVIRAQVEQTALRNELLGLENERRQLQARLNAWLARPVGAPLAEPERLRPVPAPARLQAAELEERVRARNPQLFADEAKIQAAEKSRDLAYKNRYPDFTFGVVPNQTQTAVRQWDMMVEVNVPLQQATRRAQERESEAMLAAARTRKAATANQVLGELAETLSGLDVARRTEILTTSSLLPQAELTFQAALPGYETGKVDFATLLDAQKQIRLARQNILKAQAEAQIRLADLEKLLGEEL
ncbi:TolC family protein [Propionivibrio dicarboxylicus]|uniref:Outer membrane protein TolC n=1 Tax=Propionivibrio dicarboxylicus TaxID=83767 RepID=A0A1G8I0V0_9RHOO|nr:TolC family protein [Propionivibrio dicarboxylicus]SDI12528.1 Outer membrane protein TolC [Propionivibrio dicarboxylicus]